MRRRSILALVAAAIAGVLSGCLSLGGHDVDALARGFRQPPPAARPWTYWFWMNGNITKAGITADLEAMQRVGIGGVLIMEVDQGAPLGPVGFASPAWRELFQHVCGEADRLGLQVNMNDDAGWCGSGGPWITPELSMQKVVWSETPIDGPRRFDDALPQPASVAIVPPLRLCALGSRMYFAGSDATHGRELWVSYGTPAGTALLADLRPGAAPGSPRSLVAAGDRVFVSLDDGVAGDELRITGGIGSAPSRSGTVCSN